MVRRQFNGEAPERGELWGSRGQRNNSSTFPRNWLAETREAAVLRAEEKEIPALTRGLWPFLRAPSGPTLPVPPGKDAAAQGEAQEGDVQGQERAEAGHAGGPAADHHRGAAHAGCGCAPDRGVRVRGYTPHCHRVSASLAVDTMGRERRRWRGKQSKNGFLPQSCP